MVDLVETVIREEEVSDLGEMHVHTRVKAILMAISSLTLTTTFTMQRLTVFRTEGQDVKDD